MKRIFLALFLVFSLAGCGLAGGAPIDATTDNMSVDICINQNCEYVNGGSNSQFQFHDALTAIVSAGGGTLNVITGDYNTSAPITVELGGTDVFVNFDKGASITNSSSIAGVDGAIFYVTDTATTSLGSFNVNNAELIGSANSGPAIYSETVHNVTLENSKVTGFASATDYGSAILTASTTNVTSINNIFSGNNGNITIGNSYTEATIVSFGKYTEWNGTTFTTMAFSSSTSALTPVYATSTNCCE